MSSDPPEAFYKQSDGTATGQTPQQSQSYQPYRPSAPQNESSQTTAPTRYYQAQADNASRPTQAPYPEDEAPPPPSTGYQPYQPYAPAAPPPPPPEQSQLPTIYVQEPTPITPSSSISRRPGGFPVENQGGQPINVDPVPTHPAEYTLPDRTQPPPAPPQASGALPPQDFSTSELPSEPERPPYVTPAAVAVPPPAREDYDDLYAADLPPGAPRPPQPPPERYDERPSSSALPLYDHPEGISLEQEYAQPEKSSEKPYPEVVPSQPLHDPPPSYAQPEGVVLDSGAAQPGKAAQQQTAPPPPQIPKEYYAPEKAPIAPFIGSATGSAPYRPIPDTPPPLPPRRSPLSFAVDDDPSNPVHYTRDPHKLIAYLIPFPKPKSEGSNTPDRFLIYTPPPPPLPKPLEGEKETKSHKIQRKWQEEVRAAKTSKAKAASWAGVKSKATKGISWAMSQTVSANLEFITRMQPDAHGRSRSPSPSGKEKDHHAEDGVNEGDTTHKTVGLEELVLIYPSSLPGTPEQLRTEFVNTMLRSRSKAQRDSIIATGLLPVTFAIDIISTPIWPFGGLFEVDAVWAYSSIRGARIARSTTKRLTSTGDSELEKNALQLRFQPSARLDVLRRYLATRCHERNPKRFGSPGIGVTESEVLEAIGWSPSMIKDGERNWEDEQWELQEVKDDLRAVMRKGAREWDRWVGSWESDPKKAAKK